KAHLFLSIFLFILQDCLCTSKAAEVSCTQYCSKTTQLHCPTKKIDFELDSLSCLKEFTSRFTNNFVILTEAFLALGKLDP
ncbi:hypothetical protein, partial [Thiolapillus sp.]|uniref:hypothetical protein n=1 Tax=Thiolapillus sp. TaxID=2017437 RepID=UPI003AF95745